MMTVPAERKLHPLWHTLYETWKGLLALFLVALVAGSAAFFVTNWLLQAQKRELEGIVEERAKRGEEQWKKVSELEDRLLKLEESTTRLKDMVESESQSLEPGSVLEVRAALRKNHEEIAALQEKLELTEKALNDKVVELEQRFREAVGQEVADTSSRYEILKWQHLLLRIRQEVLKVKTNLLAQDSGQAQRELQLSEQVLSKYARTLPHARQEAFRQIQDELARLRKDLAAGTSTALDRLELFWHQLGDLLEEGETTH